MKKIFCSLVTAVAVVAAMVSCSHKEIEVVDKTGYQYRFVIAETDTRATLDDQGVFWEVGDEVGVFLGEQLASANAPVNATDDPKTIEVTSTEPVATVYAYYPYNAANEAGATTAEIVFPASQAGGSVSAMPMAGLPTEVNVGGEGSANGVIHFVNLGSVIDFRIYSSGEADYSSEMVESVTFRAPGMAVSGTATLDLTQVSYDESTKTVTVPEMTMIGGAGTTSATVTQSASVATSKTDATTPIYLVVAPGTYTGTIVVNTNAASYTFSYENREFKRNGLRKYNLNLNNATREALTKTYEYQTSLTDGETYLIGGSESAGLYIALFPTVKYSNDTNDKCAHVLYNSSNAITTITTDNTSIINSEVVMEKADSKWLVKVKNTGLYMYSTKNYEIQFTDDASIAGHTYSYKVNNRNDVLKIGNLEFYHSGSIDNNAGGFTYYTNKGANNLRFYKLSGSTKSQSIWFEQPEGTVLAPDAVLTYDLASAEPFVAPVLKGAKTTVLYESSNSAIASVDAISGAVTFGGTQRGTVTITATAAGESGYASATASYKIDVSDSSIPVSVYNKVTSVSDLEPGAKYLLVFEGLAGDTDGDGNPKVFSAVLNSNGTEFLKNGSAALDVTIANGVIESSDFDNCQFTLEAGYYLKGDQANKYIYPGSVTSGYSTSSVMLAESTASHQLTIAFNNGIAEIANGGRYLVWSTSSHYFSCNTEVSGQYSTGICLYKLYDSRQAQTLVFTGSEAKYDLGIEEWTVAVPTVSGNETFPLTWTSSDEAVATVDASGNVTPVAKGTTTIKVTAPANETYKSGSASFTVTVFNSNVPTYYKADEMQSGEEYLIVSNGYALRNNSGTVAATPVEITEGVIKYDAPSTDLWTAMADGDAFTLTNNEQYLLLTTSSSWGSTSYSLSIGSASSTAANNQWTYDSDEESLRVNSRYVYVNGSAFTTSSSFGDAKKAALYSTTPPLPAWEISFNVETATYDKYTGNWTTTQPILATNATTTVTYGSSDPTVATVSSTGAITALKAGSTTITATAAADATHKKTQASYTLTVVDSTPKARNLQFSASTYSVAVNDSPNPPTLSGDKMDDVNYTSSNTGVAEVDPSTGALTLKAEGQTTITASAGAVTGWQAGSASYALTVTAALPEVTYTKVMSGSELAADDVILLVYENGASSKVFKPILNSSKNAMQVVAANAVAAAVDNNQIVSAQLASCQITLKNRDANGPKFSMLVPKADGTTDYYFRINNATLSAQTTDPGYRPTFTINNGTLSLVRSSYYLRYSATNSYFESSTSTPSNMAVYKIDDGQPKARDLAFSESSMSVDIYGKTFPYALTGTPTLTGLGLGDVTYAVSGDSGVASVVASSGVVTLLGETGTVTITASAPATDDFQSGSASYTLTVTNTPPPTYTLISGDAQLVTGTYVITDKKDTYLFNASGTNNGGYSTINTTAGVTRSGSTITLANDVAEAHEFVITRTDNTLTIMQVGGTHAGQYMFATANTNSTYIGFQGPAKNFTLNPQENTALIYFYTDKSSSSPTEYLYKKTSDAFFKLGGSGAPGGGDAGVYLYKKND